jgi:hypothetical protein
MPSGASGNMTSLSALSAHSRRCVITPLSSHEYISNKISMSADTIQLPVYLVNDILRKHPRQPIKFDCEGGKLEISQYLSSPLTYHYQSYYIDP